MRPDGVIESCLYVDDLDTAAAFYGDVLGLELVAAEVGRHAFFRCGASMVLLFNPRRCAADGTSDVPRHGALGPGHLALAVANADLAAWREHLTRHGVAIEQIIERPSGNSLYFRDPAGNSLELTTPRIWGLPEAQESRPWP
ncbi:MAG: VOC family protein [Armatimonadetes bacterium]|nr:VOC family protein [Armatimonadota bacterium]